MTKEADSCQILARVPAKHFARERERLTSHISPTSSMYVRQYTVLSPCVRVMCLTCGHKQYTFMSCLNEGVSRCSQCGTRLTSTVKDAGIYPEEKTNN